MNIPGYTSCEEIDYIRIRPQQPLPYFAPGELTKIENYDRARSEGFYGWAIHHRLGESYLRRDLIARNLYYSRPAEELIFLTVPMHMQIHHTTGGHVLTSKGSSTYIKALHHYRHLLAKAVNGEDLSYTDERFIVEFCKRKGWEVPIGLKINSTAARIARNRAICMNLIANGFLDWDTYRQQRTHIIRALQRIGENTNSNIRAIERMFLLDPKILQQNGGVPLLKPCTLEDRRTLCANDYAEQSKDRTLQRVRILQDKLSRGAQLSDAERVFKSRHKELFK